MGANDSEMTLSLDKFEIDPKRGFLPSEDPLLCLPDSYYSPWEELAYDLPKLLVTRKVREAIKLMPLLRTDKLNSEREWRRAMVVLSYLGHAYVWGDEYPPASIPATLAVPWYEVSQHLNRLPVLSYASYVLDNWKLLDKNGEIRLGNISILQNFLGGLDEDWFILVHVDIEARAGQALSAIPKAIEASRKEDTAQLISALKEVSTSLKEIYSSLTRMTEACDPYIYYNRVRPYIHGWKNNPAIPKGLIYEGVDAYKGKPQMFRGETGAQSGIIPSLDGLLGIKHKDDPLRTYLMEMRLYMPPAHRAFIEAIEKSSQVRICVQRHKASCPELVEIYNQCLDQIEKFRTKHLTYADRYIYRQQAKSSANPTKVGTGGTPFMPYLKKHRDETKRHKLKLVPTQRRRRKKKVS